MHVLYTHALCVQHDNPKIQVVLNDGTTVYEHHSDGQRQEKASCLKEFRNRPYPVKLRITYLRGKLEVRDQWFIQKYSGISPLSLWTPSGNFLIKRGVLVSEIVCTSLHVRTCSWDNGDSDLILFQNSLMERFHMYMHIGLFTASVKSVAKCYYKDGSEMIVLPLLINVTATGSVWMHH